MSKDLFFKMREDEVAHLLTEVENGELTYLYAYANLKMTKSLIDEAINQVELEAINESELYHEKTFKQDGFVFEKRNGSTRYSYNHIPEIQKLKNDIKEIETKSKQAYLSTQKNILVADENGEDIPLPKVTYSKSILIVKK